MPYLSPRPAPKLGSGRCCERRRRVRGYSGGRCANKLTRKSPAGAYFSSHAECGGSPTASNHLRSPSASTEFRWLNLGLGPSNSKPPAPDDDAGGSQTGSPESTHFELCAWRRRGRFSRFSTSYGGWRGPASAARVGEAPSGGRIAPKGTASFIASPLRVLSSRVVAPAVLRLPARPRGRQSPDPAALLRRALVWRPLLVAGARSNRALPRPLARRQPS
jgi:hypothetical protein